MFSYSIMKFMPGHEEEVCLDIVRQYDAGIADVALFSVALPPEDTPQIPKAELFAEEYVRYRDRLKKMGKECGILAQATIGHGYKMAKPMPFTKYFGIFDDQEKFTSCPLDDGFCEYIKNSMATLAKAEPKVIMVDDDFRLFFRPGRGCACRLHMKRLSEVLDREITRDELRLHLTGTSAEDKKVAEAFIAVQGEALLKGAKAMRAGIDSVDPKLPGLFCLCGTSAEFAGEIAKILAGEGNPTVVRINNGNYTPVGAKGISLVAERAAVQMGLVSEACHVDAFLAETDTCPQNRYSTSAHNLHSHYVATILEGASGAKHWITRLANFEPRSGEAYRKILSKYSGFYKALAELYPRLSFLGARVPLPTRPTFSFDLRTSVYHNPYSSAWVTGNFERLGIPVFFSKKQGAVTCLDGEMDKQFTDTELKEILSGGVLLDVVAAESIAARGFGEYIGVNVEPWQLIHPTGDSFIKEEGRCNAPFGFKRLVPTGKVHEDSYIYYLKNGKEKQMLAPSVTLFENSLGGKVIVYAGKAKTNFTYTEAFSLLNQPRKAQLVRLFDEITDLPVYYDGDLEVYMKAAYIEGEENTIMATLFNIGLDPLDEITLGLRKTPTSVEYLTPDGERKPVSFTKTDLGISVDLPFITLEPQVIFLKY